MDLELKIHPPIVFGFCALLAWAIDRTIPTPINLSDYVPLAVAVLIVTMGVLLATLAAVQFFRVKTTIHPDNPDETSSLVTTGVYRVTRNPMYLGLSLVLIGWLLFLGNLYGAVTLVLMIAYISRFQIRPEERILLEKFGQAYADYCGKVRRWL